MFVRIAFALCLVCGAATVPSEIATLDGQRIPSEESRRRHWEREGAARWENEELLVLVGENVYRIGRRQLGAARHLERTQNDWFAEEYRWRVDIDEARLLRNVDALREQNIALPLPQLIGPLGQPEGGRQGQTLPRGQSATAIREALLSSAPVVRLELVSVPAPEPLPQTLELARFTAPSPEVVSRYRASTGKGHNILRATQELDGTILPPGAVLSFNGRVGERTLARGFAFGPEVGPGGAAQEGLGGGICQVAGNLYEASLTAGLEVEQWHPHSRRVRYAEPGLDAAVSWPHQDLVVRNALGRPIRLRAVADEGMLRVWWEGTREFPEVTLRREVVSGSEDAMDRPLQVAMHRTVLTRRGPESKDWLARYPAVATP